MKYVLYDFLTPEYCIVLYYYHDYGGLCQMVLQSVLKWEFVRGNANPLFILVLGDEFFFENDEF